MKGVVRAEKLKSPEDFIEEILKRVSSEYIQKNYGIQSWDNYLDFLSKLAMLKGKLLKGGEPDINNVSVSMINDWQRVFQLLSNMF